MVTNERLKNTAFMANSKEFCFPNKFTCIGGSAFDSKPYYKRSCMSSIKTVLARFSAYIFIRTA
jgi:hypothetical protein